MSSNWHLIDKYYAHYGDRAYVKHHTLSYDAFVRDSMRATIAALNPISVPVANNLNVYVGGRTGQDIFVAPPRLRPQQCRLEDHTYACDVTMTLTFTYESKGSNDRVVVQETSVPDVPFFSLPIMVKSEMCTLTGKSTAQLRDHHEDPLDLGGYFIVQGLEKVVVSQERNAANRLFVRDSKDPKFRYVATLRSLSDGALFPRVVNFVVYSDSGQRKNAIGVTLPAYREPIPLFVLFRALGVMSDREIMQNVVGDPEAEQNAALVDFLHRSAVDGNFLYTQEEALEFLGHLMIDQSLRLNEADRKHDIVLLQLAKDLFPATGTDLRKKALFLGDAVELLVRTCIGSLQPLDRDNLRYKRVDVTGVMFSDLFRDLYAFYCRNAQSVLEAAYNYNFKGQDTGKLITPGYITRAFDVSVMNSNLLGSLKGSWRVFKSPMEMGPPRQGVSQDLARVTSMGTMSHLRRVNTPIEDSATKMVGPHRVQGSHWGYFCPTESPDGANIGLLKHFALLAHVSPDCGQDGIRDLIASKITPLDEDDTARSQTRVRLNGVWIATCRDPRGLVEWVRLHRRNGLISPYVSVSWNVLSREVLINTDAGRCCRPLLIVTDNKLPDTAHAKAWPDLLHGALVKDDNWDADRATGYVPHVVPKGADILQVLRTNQGVVEFLDAEETETCLIASSPHVLDNKLKQYTHCEIHASTILSTVTSLLPFADHTGAARNVLSCAQTKQGVGIYANNFRQRLDNMAYVLHYPERPVVTTRQYAYQKQDIRGHGANAIVAVLAYGGYNQEDAVIINKDSVERGLLSLTYYKTIKVQESKDMSGSSTIEFGNPLAKQAGGMTFENTISREFGAIGDDGMPAVGSLIREGDVVVGMYDTVRSEVKDPNWNRTTTVVTHSDRSLVADQTFLETYIVDTVKVFQHDSKNKLRTAKIRLRQVRPPTVGDKTGSRNSQKGCLGTLMPRSEMPFTKDGLVPDIMINPGYMPKRATICQLIEGVMAKLGCLVGAPIDSTAFESLDLEAAYDKMQLYGFERHGEEVLYHGNTGQQISANVFITPVYSQRLKHMVADKVNSRRQGASTALTRQPVQGRSMGGGLRIGEMEDFAIQAYGLMGFLKESLMQRSDGWKFGLDERGQFLPPNDDTKSALVTMPYAFKLLTQEVGSLGIGVTFQTGSDVESLGSDSDEDYDPDLDSDEPE